MTDPARAVNRFSALPVVKDVFEKRPKQAKTTTPERQDSP